MSALRNDQVTLVALLLLGGSTERIDTEDVAIRADELTPGRFRWRKHGSHIDLGLVRNGLQDARKRSLVAGGAIKGWVLTPAGIAEAEALLPETASRDVELRVSREQKAWAVRERSRLLREPAYRIAREGGSQAVAYRDVLRFFKIDEYVADDKRTERIRRFLTTFDSDPELGPVVKNFVERLSNGE